MLHQEDIDLLQFPDRIASSFDSKTLLLTGATGLVGKLLIERLLHNTEVKKIYVLIRNKRGVDIRNRFLTYFDNEIFNSLKQDRGIEILTKIEPISGDVSHATLDISEENRLKLIEEVDIVYHSAANLRFDGALTDLILTNVRGTKLMLELAQKIKHLKLFTYISTTYCLSSDKILPEGPIQPPFNPHDMISIAENIDKRLLNILTAKFLEEHNDTYVLSKCLAESLIYEQVNKMPVMVVRPSIIMPCVQIPIPGYTDNFNGPIGTWVLAGKGIQQVVNVPYNIKLQCVPADMFINTLLITSYNFIENTARKTAVCNATNYAESQDNWQEHIIAAENRVPLNSPIWYQGAINILNPILFLFAFYLVQLLPAIVLDFINRLFGRKPIYVKIQRKIMRVNVMVHKYLRVKNWNVEQEHIQHLAIDLNPREEAAYPLSMDDVDVFEWMVNILLSLRRGLLHETDEELPAAIRRRKIMYVIHQIVKWSFYGFVLKFIYATVLS